VNKHAVLSALRKRLRQFKRHGYDLPASRNYILKSFGIRNGTTLEIGTGKGHLTKLLAKKNLRAISIDLDPGALAAAKIHLSAAKADRRILLRKMNAEKLPFRARSFDHVISVDFFHHAKRPLRCLREMTRAAKKTLTIADLNKRGMRIMALVHQSEGKTHATPKIPFRKLKSYLSANGFNVKSYRQPCHEIFVAQRRNS